MPVNIFTTIIVVLFLYGIWATYSKQGKVFCVYENEAKQVSTHWARVKNRKVVIGNRRFEVMPECVQSMWNNKGIHSLFPTRVDYLHLVHYSKYPINPNDYKRSWDTPELRNLINLDEILQSYFKNYKPKDAGKKVTGMMQYLPMIAIVVLVVLVAFYLNSQLDGMKNVINMMQGQIQSIMP